jgi:hypothetical protein
MTLGEYLPVTVNRRLEFNDTTPERFVTAAIFTDGRADRMGTTHGVPRTYRVDWAVGKMIMLPGSAPRRVSLRSILSGHVS